MTTATERASPLVYAEPTARIEAVELLPAGAVLEREVERLIARGRKTRWTWYGEQVRRPYYVCRSDDGWSALIRRSGGHLRKRRGVWLVKEVFATRSERPS